VTLGRRILDLLFKILTTRANFYLGILGRPIEPLDKEKKDA
jgi:hypothetical protein